MFRSFHALVLCPVLLCAVGCHVSNQKNGKSENVDIGTPFGSMQVKTNGNVSADTTGISVYPGAVPQKKEKDGDENAADVNMSFGSFHLGVKAVSYVSTDPPAKVMSFYKKDLTKFGAVLQCNGGAVVGQPTRTEQGLTCTDDHTNVHINNGVQLGVNTADNSTKTELRTGSKQHQHIVAFEPHDAGTKFSLIALDLPGDIGQDDEKKTN